MRPLFLALWLLFLAPLTSAHAQDVLPPNYAPLAEAYVVEDLDSGRILYSKNPDERLYPASTTKTMTALVAFEHASPAQVITVTKEAATTGESSVYLQEGERRTLEELLRAAMVRSANDACVAMADGIAGSIPKFADLMNAKVKALGLKNTHFVNPHGLHDPQHYTSARDLATIARAFTRVPLLNGIVRLQTTVIGGNAKVGPRLLRNRNKLLFRWPACDGLKTGSTKEAGHCLIATATERDPRTGRPWRLLSVVMKSHGNFTYLDTEFLLQKAFASFAPRAVAKPGEVLWRGDVGGAHPLEAATQSGVELPLRADELGHVTAKVSLLRMAAPFKRGQVVGSVAYVSGGATLAQIPLVARADVPQSLLARAVGGGKWPVAPRRLLTLAATLCAGLAILLLIRRARSAPRRRPKRHARSKPAFEPLDPRDIQPRR